MPRRSALALWAACALLPSLAAADRPPPPPPPGTPSVADPYPRPGGEGLAWIFDALGLDDLAAGWLELTRLPPAGALGGPRPELSTRELLAFAAGRAAFARRFSVAEGLGPHYNEAACGDCHAAPALGGVGTLPQHVIHVMEPADLPGETVGRRRLAVAGFAVETAPGRAGRRRTPPLFGLGLLDAVPESALAARADPDDRDGDGVRGRLPARQRPQGWGSTRFGAKSHEWNLWRFLSGAMRDEMGMTNAGAFGPQADADAVADPEVPPVVMRRIDAFVRGLAPPPPLPPTAEASAGADVFARIGCAACHAPDLGSVRGVYSDLLVHDMGPALDAGLDDGPSNSRQWRTPPLWGLRFRPRLLHDERVTTPAAAIGLHGGEAQGAQARFAALPAAERDALLVFLSRL